MSPSIVPKRSSKRRWHALISRRAATIKRLQLRHYEKADPAWKALAKSLTGRLRVERPQFFLSVRFGDNNTADLFRKHFSRVVDQIIMGQNRARKLQDGERTWFLLIPEEHSGETNWHGYLRLPRVRGRRNLCQNFMRFPDLQLSLFLTRLLRWKFGVTIGKKQNGEEKRSRAFVDVHLRRMFDRSYRRIAIYPLKRSDAVAKFAERLESW